MVENRTPEKKQDAAFRAIANTIMYSCEPFGENSPGYNKIQAEAILKKEIEQAKKIVTASLERGLDVDKPIAGLGETMLEGAARFNQTDIALLILEHNPKKLDQALLYAAENGNTILVKALVEKGADPNHEIHGNPFTYLWTELVCSGKAAAKYFPACAE